MPNFIINQIKNKPLKEKSKLEKIMEINYNELLNFSSSFTQEKLNLLENLLETKYSPDSTEEEVS